uniref:Uncharacterized protein n=1 Tax=Arundo donax TaxID=35708 RepID=A0A0A9HRI8_ARUDO
MPLPNPDRPARASACIIHLPSLHSHIALPPNPSLDPSKRCFPHRAWRGHRLEKFLFFANATNAMGSACNPI